MAAIYAVYTSPTHPPIPNHLPTLIVTPHGQPSNILYSYLHTNFNTENYLLTPSPQGDLCVAKLFPPRARDGAKGSASDPGHSSPAGSRVVRCEASRNLKWSIANTGVISPIYKLSLPSPDSPDLPLFQISKPNPNAAFWSMFYFAYAGHNIPPKRIEFGKIQKNPPGQNGGGTRISITGKTPEEKAVWQTLGEGNEDCVEWVVLCAALNLLDDEIVKAAEKAPGAAGMAGPPVPVTLRDSPVGAPSAMPPRTGGTPAPGSVPPGSQRPPPGQNYSNPRPPNQQYPPPNPNQVPMGGPPPGPNQGFPPNQLPPGQNPNPGRGQGYPGPGQGYNQGPPPAGGRGQGPPPGQGGYGPPQGYGRGGPNPPQIQMRGGMPNGYRGPSPQQGGPIPMQQGPPQGPMPNGTMPPMMQGQGPPPQQQQMPPPQGGSRRF
ncbi:hypothetical protein BT96DRAFT_975987 [Gymnopus androsaceus JB14]|uniref:Uncharacterized protein n=1 Tax=Gymnopus androsaceus JB14 TaxID=1447944 RepID=A0A6A4HQM4_9AGAR|nr:hypothetical protein BT96DRAFT_975987 [Gymnopus androsaceus JB14]